MSSKPAYKPPAPLTGPVLTKRGGLQYQLTEEAVALIRARSGRGNPPQTPILNANLNRTKAGPPYNKRSTRRRHRSRKQSRKHRRYE